MSSTNVLDLIRRRRSQRVEFRDEPVRPEDVDYLIEAARWAPSPFNTQPWQLLFVTEPEKKAALGVLTRDCIVEQFKNHAFLEAVAGWTRLDEDEWQRQADGVLLGDQLPESSFAKAIAPLLMKHARVASIMGKMGAGNAPGRTTERMLTTSPLICVLWRDHSRRSPGDSGDTWVQLAIGAMFQNLLLAATERGIGAQFVNAALERPEDRQRVRVLFHAPKTLEPLVIFRLGYVSSPERPSVRRPKTQIVRWEEFEGDAP